MDRGFTVQESLVLPCTDSCNICLALRYGEEFSKASKKGLTARRPVRLLYFEGNHYNLLL